MYVLCRPLFWGSILSVRLNGNGLESVITDSTPIKLIGSKEREGRRLGVTDASLIMCKMLQPFIPTS